MRKMKDLIIILSNIKINKKVFYNKKLKIF